MSRWKSAVALLALGGAAACADTAAPTAQNAPDAQAINRAKAADGVPVYSGAKEEKVEGFAVRDRSHFNIQLRFASPITDAQRAVFEGAAARWEKLITADVPSISGSFPAGYCFAGMPAFSGTIDDIMIDVQVRPIDGPGKILGAAGPCLARNSDGLTSYGIMYFDVADLDFLASYGLFDETITHEMGHILGIGSLWNYGRSLRTADYSFIGKYANLQFHEAGGTGFVPVENMYGAGTQGSHWRESSFNNELMTGFINLGENPLSRITIGSLRDLGYKTSMAGEDYTFPQPAASSMQRADATDLEGIDIANGEILLDLQGVVVSQP
jgi:leishmanolysin